MPETPPSSAAPGIGAVILQQLAAQVRTYAKEAGTSCDMPECNALTLGPRCEGCSKRICPTHSYWRLAMVRVTPYCAYCVLAQNAGLFEDEDDEPKRRKKRR